MPFVFLLRTLLLPWKNIADRTKMRGIDLSRIMEKLSLGLLAVLLRYTLEALVMRACRGPVIVSMPLAYSVDAGMVALLLFGGAYCLGWL